MIIAIDGPAGAGKSTIAKLLSKQLSIEYIDSGAMYRSLTLYGLRNFHQVEGKEDQIADFFAQSPEYLGVSWRKGLQEMQLGTENISQAIRTSEVTAQTKFVANHPACREVVNQKIRDLAQDYSFVVDGRDIGTVVFPQAQNKFYLDASPQIRAIRRALEMGVSIEGEDFEVLKADIIARDRNDMEREVAPLKQADNATFVDTSSMNAKEVVQHLTSLLVQE